MAGIGSFVKHTKESGGSGGQWLDWKDDKQIAVWLHTMVPPVPRYSHQFMMLDVGEDRDTGRPKHFLRWPRFNSPDPEIVHRNQRFRDKQSDSLKVPPDRDPFLLLREWLRRAEHIGLEDPIFQWKNPKDGEVITWRRGELSGRVKRGKNFGHSLDTREEYLMTVVDHGDVDKGLQLTAETGLLGRRLGEVIAQQIKLLGDDAGDPLITPYAFIWEFDKKSRTPVDSYKVYKADGYEVTDEIWALITSNDYPDPQEFCSPRDGDLEKIRTAMQEAAQVDLPLDEIFSEDFNVRLALSTGERPRPARTAARQAPAQRPGPSPSPQSTTSQQPTSQRTVQRPLQTASTTAASGPRRTTAAASQARPGAAPTAQTPAAKQPARTVAKPAQSAPAAPGAPPATTKPPAQPRRRKVEEPAPPVVETAPEGQMVGCDSCGALMLVTQTECACGAKYELLDDALEEAAPSASAAPADETVVEEEECFACRSPVVDGVCTNEHCAVDHNDSIPF